VGQIHLFVQLVLEGRTSLRGAARLFPLLSQLLDLPLGGPDWSTGRWWLMRLGLAKLQAPKEQADDWVWLIDTSIQVGKEKCLKILGLRRSAMPPKGKCLCHEHVQPLHLRVLAKTNMETVDKELEAAAARHGVPCAIVNDHGTDVHGGVRLFRAKHPQTREIYDITHKGACLLKHRLEKDARWSKFTQRVKHTKIAVQQTDLAFAAPPNQRSKARYMNLETLLGWATKTLQFLAQPALPSRIQANGERLQRKVGWLRDYQEALAEWSEWHALVSVAESRIRRGGWYAEIAKELAEELTPLATRTSGRDLLEELLSFVADQVSQLQPEERLPASTEVLESCFGKLKALERDQAKNGFTGLVLGLGAFVWKTTKDVVHWAMEACSVADVQKWCEANLGTTVHAQRRLAYQPSP
jgi:hypothetical protein